jgi:2'-hydroxyisoflavone reductase
VTDRFTYWIERMARGGEVLGPPSPSAELQWVDARDLCPWIVELVERDRPGLFNAAGPAQPTTWEATLRALAQGAAAPAEVRWSTHAVLAEVGVQLPLVRAPRAGVADSQHFDSAAAQAAGLSFRPLAETAAATRAWWATQPAEERANPRGWPTPEQERAALERLSAG